MDISDGPSRGDGFCCCDDGIGVDTVMAVEVLNRAGMPEMLDAERAGAVAGNRTEPSQRGGVATQHRDEAAILRQVAQQLLDMAAGVVSLPITRFWRTDDAAR